MKQTALEYLEENLIAIPYSEQDFEYNNNCWNKAKEMGNEQKKQYQLSIKCLIDFVDAVDSEKVILAEEYENAKRVINQFKKIIK